jgi:RNA polymerase sigma-70 factor (ECF subfamily)
MSIALTLKSYFVSRSNNENLMLRYAKTGDKALLTQLYETCGNDLYHFVMTLSEPTLAKDICQKTWLKVIEKKHLYQNSGQFKAWLFTLARNQLIDEYRTTKLSTNNVEVISDKNINLSQHRHEQNLNLCFDQALLALTFEQRETFCLQQEGFSLQDIATITHSGAETVKSRLRYAKENLRKHLSEYGGANHD